MFDQLLIATLLAVVCLHWLVELLPGRERDAWRFELFPEPVPARSLRRTPRRR